MSDQHSRTFDAVVIGAGFAGLYALYKLRKMGLSVKVFEAGDGVGGTWYWNRYPGARCDVESMEYSYSFDPELEQEWIWPDKYSKQADILKYANHVAERFNLMKDIEFETRIKSVFYERESNTWRIKTAKGRKVVAQFCVMAVGNLSTPRVPDFKGV
ncbi:MAG TPA: cyclohexanone monooxygenase, partial [Gammaproteobacteria bacterium]|nr:cyclohexanone monooxygenase [Gammaproteobacteria bacterium]